jgi:chaperonin GroES
MVVRHMEEAKTKSLILTPDSAKPAPKYGQVVSVGSGVLSPQGERIPLEVSAGDVILFTEFSGVPVVVDGQPLFVMRECDVLAIVQNTEVKAPEKTMDELAKEVFDQAHVKDEPTTGWKRIGGGCMLKQMDQRAYPCDDEWENIKTGQKVKLLSTQEAHMKMPRFTPNLESLVDGKSVIRDERLPITDDTR